MSAPFDPQQILDLAAVIDLPLSPGEDAAILELAREIVPPTLVNGPAPVPAPAPTRERTDLGRPSTEEDPLNAYARRTRVIGEASGGPLEGLRITVKDSIAVAGIPLQAGSAILEGFVPDRDASVTRRVLDAGAEIVGITNMDDLAYSGAGNTSVNGPTLNPFDTTRIAGGSSSGAAASLSYDNVDAGLGTDQGGSIRLPASWTNTFGLKPTFGLVSYAGIVGLDATVDHVGPLARDVRMIARILDVIAGPDADDPRQTGRAELAERAVDAVDAAPASLEGVRLAVPSFLARGDIAMETGVRDAFDRFSTAATAAGVATHEVDIEAHVTAGLLNNAIHMEGTHANMSGGGNPYQHIGAYWPQLSAAIAEGMRTRSGELSLHLKIQLLIGKYFQDTYRGELYATAQALRGRLLAQYEAALEGADAIVLPTSPRLPYPVDHGLPAHEFVLEGWRHLAFTSPSDLTGHPAISMPLSHAEGLPVGIMIIGRRFADDQLLALARRFESVLGVADPKNR